MSYRALKRQVGETNSTARNDGPRQARIAFHLSLWPSILFASFLVVFYSIVFASALSGVGRVVEPIAIFVLQAIPNPFAVFPLLASLLGIIMGSGSMRWRVDPETTKIAARAVILGSASLAAYAYLLLIRSGIGR